MSFDWKLYVDLSAELINHHKTPSLKDAYLRSAVSRAYYAIFCTAKQLLVLKTVFFPREDIHKFVREEYNRAVSRKEKQIGSKLGRLWTERKAADYDADETFDFERAKTSQQMAADTLKLLEEISKPRNDNH